MKIFERDFVVIFFCFIVYGGTPGIVFFWFSIILFNICFGSLSTLAYLASSRVPAAVVASARYWEGCRADGTPLDTLVFHAGL